MIEIDRTRFAELKQSMGMWEARHVCVQEALVHQVQQAQTVEELRAVLLTLIANMKFTQ